MCKNPQTEQANRFGRAGTIQEKNEKKYIWMGYQDRSKDEATKKDF